MFNNNDLLEKNQYGTVLSANPKAWSEDDWVTPVGGGLSFNAESGSLTPFKIERTRGKLGGSSDVAVIGMYGDDTGVKNSPVSPETNSGVGGPSPAQLLKKLIDRRCGSSAILAECSQGDYHYAKVIYCGSEWCPKCGEDGSEIHQRRYAGYLKRIQKIALMGYFVIELPDRYRITTCYTQSDIKDFRQRVINCLGGVSQGRKGRVGGFFKRGVSRFHWFGDKNPGKYNPHLNILVDAGYLAKGQLKVIKAALRAATGIPDLIVNYRYTSKAAKMCHIARYVTRSTFRNIEWDMTLAHELYKFRNVTWWGSWKTDNVWNLEAGEGLAAVAEIQENKCPHCHSVLKQLGVSAKTGKPVYWSRPINTKWLDVWQAKELAGSGYYEIQHDNLKDGPNDPVKLIRLSQFDYAGKFGQIDGELVDKRTGEIFKPVNNWVKKAKARAKRHFEFAKLAEYELERVMREQ